MKRVRTFIQRVIITFAVLTGVALMIFYLMFYAGKSPEIASGAYRLQEHLHAIQREVSLVATSLTTATLGLSPNSVAAPRADDSNTSATVDFFAELGRLEQAGMQEIYGRADFEGIRAQSGLSFNRDGAYMYIYHQYFMRQSSDQPFDPLSEPSGNPGRTVMQDLKRIPRQWLAYFEWSNRHAASPISTNRQVKQRPASADIKTGFQELLDKTEHFLLSEWRVQSEPDPGTQMIYAFKELAALTVARACLEGDEPKARRLFVRYLDSLALMNPAYGRMSPFQATSDLVREAAIYSADSREPAAGLEEAARKLSRFKISPDEVKAMILSYYRQESEQNIQAYQSNQRYSDHWESRLERKLDDIFIVQPARVLQAKALDALMRGDFGEMAAIQRQSQFFSQLFGEHLGRLFLQFGGMPASIHSDWRRFLPKPDNSAYSDKEWLISQALLAILRFQVDRGHDPSSKQDLIPYLEADVRDSSLDWRLIQIEPFRHPLIVFRELLLQRSAQNGQPDPFSAAAYKYDDEHGRLPLDLDEIKPYLPANFDLSAAQDRFADFPGTVGIVVIQPVEKSRAAFFEVQRARNGDLTTPPTPEELQTLQGKGREQMQAIEIQGRCLAPATLDPRLRPWLVRSEALPLDADTATSGTSRQAGHP